MSEIITDIDLAADLLQNALRRRSVRRPADLTFMLKGLIEEHEDHCKLCDHADYLYVVNGNTAAACMDIDRVLNWLTRLRNNHAFLQNQLESCKRIITRTNNENLPPTITKARMVSVLKQIGGDFDGWRMEHSLDGWVFAVLTKPIQLYCDHERINVPFGRFIIKIYLNQLVRNVSRPYKVSAETPLLISDDNNCPHPHVRDDLLCEGDGMNAIDRALKLGDLFLLCLTVDQTLRTYNPDSPYIRLPSFAIKYKQMYPTTPIIQVDDSRRSITCSICSEQQILEETESTAQYLCASCDEYVCHDCQRYCDAGDTVLCSVCLDESDDLYDNGCEGCQSFATSNCLVRQTMTCTDCGRTAAIVLHCPTHHRRLCLQCLTTHISDRNACCDAPSRICALGTYLASTMHTWYDTIGSPNDRDPAAEVQPQNVTGFAPEAGQTENNDHIDIGRLRINTNVRPVCANCDELILIDADIFRCGDIAYCRTCMEDFVAEGEACCRAPTQACAFGQMLLRGGYTGAYADLPAGDPVVQLHIESPEHTAGAGFEPEF